MRQTIIVLVLGGMLLAACGSGSTEDVSDAPPTSEPTGSNSLPPSSDDGATFPAAMGPGISVADALASTVDEPLLVNGYLFVYADGSVVLADLIAESFPPQPAGATVVVEGLDLAQVPLTEGPADMDTEITAWTDSQVQLIGELVDGVFVGSSVASA